MAEFLLRATALDAALLRRMYGLDGLEGLPARPGRVVVDAHVANSSRGNAVPTAVRRAGVPLLIDPRTFYLQGTQHPGDPWALLPYGRPEELCLNEVDRFGQEELVSQVVDHHDHLLRAGLAEVSDPSPPRKTKLHNAARAYQAAINELTQQARLAA